MLGQRLRHRITVQQQFSAQDSTTGAVETTWGDVLPDEPAQVVPESAREFRASGTKQGETRGRITIRNPGIGVDSAMRIVWQGVNYQIEGVMPDPSDRRWLTIMYSQGVNSGR